MISLTSNEVGLEGWSLNGLPPILSAAQNLSVVSGRSGPLTSNHKGVRHDYQILPDMQVS